MVHASVYFITALLVPSWPCGSTLVQHIRGDALVPLGLSKQKWSNADRYPEAQDGSQQAPDDVH